eukprot:gene25677-biopygen19508
MCQDSRSAPGGTVTDRDRTATGPRQCPFEMAYRPRQDRDRCQCSLFPLVPLAFQRSGATGAATERQWRATLRNGERRQRGSNGTPTFDIPPPGHDIQCTTASESLPARGVTWRSPASAPPRRTLLPFLYNPLRRG